MKHLRVWTAAGAVAIAACAKGPEQAVTTRDSAGIAIVESAAPIDGDRPRYLMDSIPTVEIGAGGEFAEDVIPAELSDGRIVVANPRSAKILTFDGRGQLLETIGGQGGGPGEFESLSFVGRLPGDSLIAFEAVQRRYSVFDDTGGFVRRAVFDPAGGEGFWNPAGVLRDGSLVVRVGFPIRPRGIAGAAVFGGQPGEKRAPTPLFRAPLDGSAPDSITSIPGSDVVVRPIGQMMGMMPIHFGSVTVVAARDSVVVVGGANGFEIDVWRPDGRLVRRFRRPFEARPVTAGDVDALITEQLASLPLDARDMMTSRLRETPHRSTKPPYDRLSLSETGEIWVRHFVTSADLEPRSIWSVFAASGAWLCDVTIPTGFIPFTITASHLLGTWTAETGEIVIRVYSLRTGSRR